MQVLLAPLFFRSRMCKHCAHLFYKANPGSWLGLHEFESLPPLGSFDPMRGFVPDYPALMMFDEYVLDGEAYELLRAPGDRVWLNEWRRLVHALDAEGSLTIQDVAAAGSAKSHTRGAMLRGDLKDPSRWWPAMAYYDALAGRAHRLLGAGPQEARELSWAFDPEQMLNAAGSDGHLHSLAVILREAESSPLTAHRELLDAAISELMGQLREVNACLVACNEMNVAPMMWAPYRGYMEAKLLHGDHDQAGAAKEFFEIVFPAYAPTTVHEFAKMRSNKGVVALRGEIIRAIESGDTLDPQYPQRILSEVLKLEAKGARMRRIVGWVATVLGVIPVPGLGLTASATAEAISAIADRRRRERWRWFYVMSDGRGVT
jgi:hypothetical protein